MSTNWTCDFCVDYHHLAFADGECLSEPDDAPMFSGRRPACPRFQNRFDEAQPTLEETPHHAELSQPTPTLYVTARPFPRRNPAAIDNN